ncbi:uncharacterized protein VTP21DRAFT_1155 [Calcarisporiella thermophila]|uniref:uncharacterized protein n=1 Tax=Calcarisporiella thermophila TaxID=911321 RepID=UPI003743242D
MEFAKKYKHWSEADWKRVVFSDETQVTFAQASGREYYYKHKSEPLRSRHIRSTLKHGGGSLMAWSCVTSHGVGNLCRIDGGLDSVLYTNILNEDYLGSLDYYGIKKSQVIFQQDNDPRHTSKVTREWLRNKRIDVLEWPSQSPDLNIMVHMWSELKRRLSYYQRLPKNKDELWERIEKEWESIGVEFVGKLYASMPERVRAVYNAKGDHTKY